MNIYSKLRKVVAVRKYGTYDDKLRRMAQAPHGRTKISSENYGKIRQMHREGKTMHEIADHFGYNPLSLYDHAKKHMQLKLRYAPQGAPNTHRAHKGQETSLPPIETGTDTRHYKPKMLTK